MPLTPFAYKMHIKLRKEGFQCPLHSMTCWHIKWKNPSPCKCRHPKISRTRGRTTSQHWFVLGSSGGISIGTLSPSTIPMSFMFLWVEWETINTNCYMRWNTSRGSNRGSRWTWSKFVSSHPCCCFFCFLFFGVNFHTIVTNKTNSVQQFMQSIFKKRKKRI